MLEASAATDLLPAIEEVLRGGKYAFPGTASTARSELRSRNRLQAGPPWAEPRRAHDWKHSLHATDRTEFMARTTPGSVLNEVCTISHRVRSEPHVFSVADGPPPFTGENAFAIMMAHGRDPVVPPSQVRPGVPEDLDAWSFAPWPKSPRTVTPASRPWARPWPPATGPPTGAPTGPTLGGPRSSSWSQSIRRPSPSESSREERRAHCGNRGPSDQA